MLSIPGGKQQEGCVHEKPLCQIHLSFSLIFLLSSTPGSGFAEDRKVIKDKTLCNELRSDLWQLAMLLFLYILKAQIIDFRKICTYAYFYRCCILEYLKGAILHLLET